MNNIIQWVDEQMGDAKERIAEIQKTAKHPARSTEIRDIIIHLERLSTIRANLSKARLADIQAEKSLKEANPLIEIPTCGDCESFVDHLHVKCAKILDKLVDRERTEADRPICGKQFKKRDTTE